MRGVLVEIHGTKTEIFEKLPREWVMAPKRAVCLPQVIHKARRWKIVRWIFFDIQPIGKGSHLCQ